MTCDWDPAKYNYGHERAGSDAGCFDSSNGAFKDEFYHYEVASTVANEDLDQRRTRWLKNRFEALLMPNSLGAS